ncbi:MAG: response regulator [Spirochaetes bacterium]|nr:response regulator [Spirochaetota bacterium]
MNGKILLIEDNEQNRYLATFLLNRRGYAVTEAVDGKAGIDCAAKERFDLVLLDIQLPGMDGYAVAAALRGNPETGDVPIIAVTSYAMVGDREKALASGCNGYIEKPINPETFVSEIERFIAPQQKGTP